MCVVRHVVYATQPAWTSQAPTWAEWGKSSLCLWISGSATLASFPDSSVTVPLDTGYLGGGFIWASVTHGDDTRTAADYRGMRQGGSV